MCVVTLTAIGCSAADPPDVSAGTTSSREVFCADDWYELTTSPGQGFNAVGYLSNGCTAFLIDANHIAAAGHCFTDTRFGTWQTPLRFYPNFHPSRLGSPPYDHVPRADVGRAVVGKRMDLYEQGNDWGIAQVSNWRDTAGVDLTPVSLVDAPYVGLALAEPGYARQWFSHDGSLSDMMWDNGVPPGRCTAGQGMWAVPVGQPPAGEVTACNERWAHGQVRYNCTINSTSDDAIFDNCDSSGGNSGSPLLSNVGPGGQLAAVGIRGGGINYYEITDWTTAQPQCNPNPYDPNYQNFAAGAGRLVNAPRFATNVAIANRKDGGTATGVFAADADTLHVRYRERLGSPATLSSPFSFWSDIGGASGLGSVGSIAACNQHPRNQTPRVFFLYYFFGTATLYTNTAPFTGAWTSFGLPSGNSSAYDIDAHYDANGRCQLFLVGGDGKAYTRRMTSDTTWSSTWDTVSVGTSTYRKITAMYNGSGITWAILKDSAAQMFSARFDGTTWTSAPVGPPAGVTVVDIDFGFDPISGNAVIWMLDTNSWLWQRSVSNFGRWSAWSNWPTVLYTDIGAPGATPTLATITASRWLEDTVYWRPMIFATDTWGNVYELTISSAETGWKSFYSKYLPTAGGY